MKRMLGLVLALSVTGLTRAAEAPAHNKLTPQEIADGWILLFDGESTFGWTAPNGSKWTIVNGMLAPQQDKPGLLVTTTAFKDYQLSFQFRARNSSKVELLVGCDREGRVAEVKKDEKVVPAPEAFPPVGTRQQLRHYNEDWFVADVKVIGGEVVDINTYPYGSRFGFFGRPPRVEGFTQQKPAGHIGLSGSGVIYRDIRLKPLETKPLFTGKDLKGWKKFDGDEKRAKSKFGVSPEGWLTIKDGPGDLQTEGQWADFVLQIECKTNGKNLNSGVFFRCRPGEYQNGYEAQIHNGWLEKSKEVAIEEYDPRTHELKEKRPIQTKAMDYGTGAIYRRMPARKEVAKDNEWFTMTVVAQGNHLATWVNGEQVVDWTDNRPLKDNARNGCRLEKGPISLQGHDPTTDLAFRNIRLVDLTPVKREEKEAIKPER